MPCFDGRRRTRLLDGLPTGLLRKQLVEAQLAYLALIKGGKGETFSYAQGDGTKAVTYTRANIGALAQLIESLQIQLGISPGRRPITFWFD